jgi:bacillithiol biosynthesis cysteine-adding enzyme BshC
MDCTSIPYSRVPHTSALLHDYLDHYERVAEFYSGPPFDPATYRELASALQGFHRDRRRLCDILTRQNKAFGAEEPTFANIGRLSEPGTFAVVTGQQAGLLSGPAFTLYKALTAVRLAQSLSEQGIPSVPVFWLATEDHDLEEVSQVSILDEESGLVSLNDPGERPAARSPVGLVALSNEITQALERLEALTPPGEPRDRLMGDLRSCYQPGCNWGQAFGSFMARLFSRWGVILLNPLDEPLHRLSSGVYEQALSQARVLRGRLMERSRALMAANYHAQVYVAEDSTLLFLAREGNRVPIRQSEDEFIVNDTEKISLDELKGFAERQPMDLSSNVLLRPVIQDMIFPTLAYVSGPSEVAYLAQSEAVYSSFGRPMPIAFPRAAFTLVERRIQRLLEKYELGVEDVWQGEEQLSRKIASRGFSTGWSERFDQVEIEVEKLLDRLHGDVEKLDPTLLEPLKTAQEKMKYQMERLRGKVSRAALQRSELLRRHVQALLDHLMPGKDLQERQVGGVYFLGRAGYELLDRILEHIRTHSSDHQVLIY